MRDVSPALANHLAGGVTTLCRCWRLTRADGAVSGYTDHDRDLTFEGVIYAAASGLAPSEAETQLGLSVGGGEVAGALTGAGLTEADIAAGIYDDAEVAGFLVNWADVSQRLLLDVGSIGEIRRADTTFSAELRSAAHRYDQPQGRLFRASCDADLGDGRCGVALGGVTVAAVVAVADGAIGFSAAALTGFAAGWFTGGRVIFTTGPNVGQTRMIKSHGAGGAIQLWEPAQAPLAPGDGVNVIAGCDKTFETCKAKFANIANFRGFPHIPTPDFILSYARSGEGGHDGGRLDP